MKLLDKISEALGLYEEEDEIIEETPMDEPEEKPKKSMFSRKPAVPVKPVPAREPEPERKSFFKPKAKAEMPASKTISIPLSLIHILQTHIESVI